MSIEVLLFAVFEDYMCFFRGASFLVFILGFFCHVIISFIVPGSFCLLSWSSAGTFILLPPIRHYFCYSCTSSSCSAYGVRLPSTPMSIKRTRRTVKNQARQCEACPQNILIFWCSSITKTLIQTAERCSLNLNPCTLTHCTFSLLVWPHSWCEAKF